MALALYPTTLPPPARSARGGPRCSSAAPFGVSRDAARRSYRLGALLFKRVKTGLLHEDHTCPGFFSVTSEAPALSPGAFQHKVEVNQRPAVGDEGLLDDFSRSFQTPSGDLARLTQGLARRGAKGTAACRGGWLCSALPSLESTRLSPLHFPIKKYILQRAPENGRGSKTDSYGG